MHLKTIKHMQNYYKERDQNLIDVQFYKFKIYIEMNILDHPLYICKTIIKKEIKPY